MQNHRLMSNISKCVYECCTLSILVVSVDAEHVNEVPTVAALKNLHK